MYVSLIFNKNEFRLNLPYVRSIIFFTFFDLIIIKTISSFDNQFTQYQPTPHAKF